MSRKKYIVCVVLFMIFLLMLMTLIWFVSVRYDLILYNIVKSFCFGAYLGEFVGKFGSWLIQNDTTDDNNSILKS